MIDGSGSIEQAGRGNFNRIKSFVKSVISGFNVGFYNTHVGAIIYSSYSYVKKVFGLGSYFDHASLSRAIDNIIYPYGATYTGKALNLARSQLYTQHQDRKGIPNLCILITDGKANDDVKAPVDALRNIGTTIFAVGAGKNFDRDELERIAGSPTNVFTADFSGLDTLIPQIKRSLCKG